LSKPYSAADFSSQIAEDRTWRIKEISDLKIATVRADPVLEKVLLRAIVTVCYAHWEGSVKFAARKYMEHIALRRLPIATLNRQFLRNMFLPRLAQLSKSNTSVSQRCDLIDEILYASEKRFTKANDDLINTQSNLNFNVFSDICLVCDISADEYSDMSSFIDVILLKRRNEIAHGENTFIALEDLDELAAKTTGLMRSFGDALDNRIALEKYKTE